MDSHLLHELTDKIIGNLRSLNEKIDNILTAQLPADEWLSRTQVMKFLGYGATQMAEFEKRGDLIVSKVGKRKFIRRDSLLRLLENNIISGHGKAA